MVVAPARNRSYMMPKLMIVLLCLTVCAGTALAQTTDLMISEYTFSRLTPDRFRTRVLDVIKVAGKTKAVKVYEVYGLQAEQFQPETLKYYDVFQMAFAAYLSQNFSEALDGFSEALSLSPNDIAAGEMIKRINGITRDGRRITRTGRRLSDDWDGSIALTSK